LKFAEKARKDPSNIPDRTVMNNTQAKAISSIIICFFEKSMITKYSIVKSLVKIPIQNTSDGLDV